MEFDLLPKPTIVKIPEKLQLELKKLQEKLEKKAKKREESVCREAIFTDRIRATKKAEPKEFARKARSSEPSFFAGSMDNFECAAIEGIKLPPKTEKTFKDLLFEMIDSRGLTDVEVYKKAGVDRKTFSKIRSNDNYHPSKGTVLQLCLSLELSIKDSLALLKSADYYLTKNCNENVVMHYLIENKIYNVIEANNIMYSTCGKEIKEL